jgi:hypothetical protein
MEIFSYLYAVFALPSQWLKIGMSLANSKHKAAGWQWCNNILWQHGFQIKANRKTFLPATTTVFIN